MKKVITKQIVFFIITSLIFIGIGLTARICLSGEEKARPSIKEHLLSKGNKGAEPFKFDILAEKPKGYVRIIYFKGIRLLETRTFIGGNEYDYQYTQLR